MEGKKKKIIAGSIVAAFGATVGAVFYSKGKKKREIKKAKKHKD